MISTNQGPILRAHGMDCRASGVGFVATMGMG